MKSQYWDCFMYGLGCYYFIGLHLLMITYNGQWSKLVMFICAFFRTIKQHYWLCFSPFSSLPSTSKLIDMMLFGLVVISFYLAGILQQYPYDIPTEAFPFEIFKQAFVAVQSCVVHLQVNMVLLLVTFNVWCAMGMLAFLKNFWSSRNLNWIFYWLLWICLGIFMVIWKETLFWRNGFISHLIVPFTFSEFSETGSTMALC